MKRSVIFLVSLCLLLTAASPAFAASAPARLYNVYADDMLFQRNADAVLAGEAPQGGTILAELFDGAGRLVTSGTAAATDGRFEVSFPSPAGGFESYTIRLSCDGTEFAELKTWRSANCGFPPGRATWNTP